MAYVKVEVNEKALHHLRMLENQLGGGPQDITAIMCAAMQTLSNILDYQRRETDRGKAQLVLFDEGNRKYRHHTELDQIIPFDMLERR